MILKGYQMFIKKPKHIPVRMWLTWKQRIPNHTNHTKQLPDE